MNPQLDLLVDIAYLNYGIIPPSISNQKGGVDKGLSTLSAAEQRKTKRKFRKAIKEHANYRGCKGKGMLRVVVVLAFRDGIKKSLKPKRKH